MQLSSLDLDGYTSAALPAVVYCAESTGEGLTLPCGGGVGRLIVVGKKKVLPFAVIIFLNPDESFFLSFFFFHPSKVLVTVKHAESIPALHQLPHFVLVWILMWSMASEVKRNLKT